MRKGVPMSSLKIPASLENIHQLTDFVKTELSTSKTTSRDVVKAMLLSEEIFVKLVENLSTDPDITEFITVRVTNFLGTKRIVISAKGEKIAAMIDSDIEQRISEMEATPLAEAAIRNMIIASASEQFRQSYRNGVNRLTITVGESSQKGLLLTLTALVSAIVFGVLCRLILPAAAQNWLDTNILTTIKTMFLNALKMIMCPVIFFSIASCIGSFTDLTELGKIGGKVLLFYLFTTLIAILMGLGMFNLFAPGSFGEFSSLSSGTVTEETGSISLLNTLINIVPSNLISAFLSADTLQIIFLAILIGAAVGTLGRSQSKVAEFLTSANDLFLKVASIITKCIPVMVFVSITSLIISADLTKITSIGSFLLTVLIADAGMMIAYCMIVLLYTHTNPFIFLKNTLSAWINAFALRSSNASMAKTMEVCENNLHIEPRLYSFSIPLGATVNMDGLTVALTIGTLFLAKSFGIIMTTKEIFSLLITIVILSMGAPGIPGTSILCMSVLLAQYGIPMEALAVYISLESFLDPFSTANNVFGDMVGTYSVAKKNGYIKTQQTMK